MTARYQPFDDLPAQQFEAFKADVEARGVVIPIVVDEHDVTIDGHQRRRAAAELHIDCPRVVVEALSEPEKEALAIALNAFRRHLAVDQRQSAILRLKALGWSNRRVADTVGIHEKQVRRELAKPEVRTVSAPDPIGSRDSDAGSSRNEAAGPDDEAGDVATPAPSPVPNPAPRVVGKDGKSYASSRPEPSDDRKLLNSFLAVHNRYGRVVTDIFAIAPPRVAEALTDVDADADWHMIEESLKSAEALAGWFRCVLNERPKPFSVVQGGRS